MLFDSAWLSLAGMSLLTYLILRYMFHPVYLEYKRIREVVKKGVFTKGIIIDHIHQLDADQKDQYAPVVKFMATDGKGYMLQSNDFRFLKKPIGERVNVCYDPDDPSDAVDNPQSQLAFKLFLMFFISVSLLAINLVLVYEALDK